MKFISRFSSRIRSIRPIMFRCFGTYPGFISVKKYINSDPINVLVKIV